MSGFRSAFPYHAVKWVSRSPSILSGLSLLASCDGAFAEGRGSFLFISRRQRHCSAVSSGATKTFHGRYL